MLRIVVVFAVIACRSCNITMRPGVCFLFAACVIYWLPSNAGSLGNGYRGDDVESFLGVPELPVIILQRGVQRSRRHPQTFRDALAWGAKMNVKRKTFWKGSQGGPLPVDDILGGYNDGQSADLGPSHKAMRYG